jgi:NTP pyrophosphatase (non-canonical NTP hydrolase)
MSYVERILKLSPKETKNLEQRFIKLNEEIGELAVAVLQSQGLKGTSKTKRQIRDNIIEEICDSLNILYSIASWHKFTSKQINDKMHKKLNKWERQIKKR